jgi:flagellar hook assembly protein FlgD
MPGWLSLLSYPNPFNSAVIINIEGNIGKESLINIFDIEGRLVRKLAVNNERAIWDATDEDGQQVPSGIYFCKISQLINSPTLKITYLK